MTNLIPSALTLIAPSVAQNADGPSLPGAAPAAPAGAAKAASRVRRRIVVGSAIRPA